MINLDSIITATQTGGSKITSENHNSAGMTGCAGLATINGKIAVVVQGSAWHSFGVRVDSALNSLEALTMSSLADWDMRKLEVFADFNGGMVPTGCYAIVRVENGKPIVLTKGRAVGARYQIVTNEELFSFLDALSGQISYETAGALGDGERVFITANIPSAEFSIANNVVQQKLAALSTHDGSMGVQVFHSTLSVVCQNTYTGALNRRRGGAKGICLRHTTNVRSKLAAAREALGLVTRTASEFKNTALAMAETKLDPVPYFDCVLDSVLSTTIAEQEVSSATIRDGSVLNAIVNLTDATERLKAESALRRYETRRDGILNEILEIYHGPKCAPAGSAWSAFSAITDSADHGGLCRYKGSDKEKDESRWQSNLLGRSDEIKTVAYDAAVASMAV